jgi:hypothetical protein
MSFKSGTSLVLLAACLTALTALPANAATSSAAARQNVIQSERYDRSSKPMDAFGRHECAESAAQSPIPNCVRAASTAFRNTSPRRMRPLQEK